MRYLPRAILLAALLLSFFPPSLLAQRENTIWYFGQNAGIDFNTSTPTPLDDDSMHADEGSAVVADRNSGALLFYSNGISVWNRDHRLMPNGTGLMGGASSTQSALIVPVPGDTTRYYLFSSGHLSPGGELTEGVWYSVVDMNGDGGLGDVVVRNVPIATKTTEKLVGVPHCNGVDYWVITHGYDDTTYHAFLVSATGVSANPVDSPVGLPYGRNDYSGGALAVSPDGRKIADATVCCGGQLLDFDPCTGLLSRPIRFPRLYNTYGVAFSPDGSKLYFGEAQDPLVMRGVTQFDLSSDDSASIVASQTRVYETAGGGFGIAALQRGPDGKIYVARCCDHTWLGVINKPDLQGSACDYNDSGFTLAPATFVRFGLPNLVPIQPRPLDPLVRFHIDDSLVCEGKCITVRDSSENIPAGSEWRWVFLEGTPSGFTGRNPPPVCYPTPGQRPVRLIITSGGDVRDMLRHVTVAPRPVADAGEDRVLCAGDSVTLGASGEGSYLWSPASGLSSSTIRNPVARPDSTTSYVLTVTGVAGCQSRDTVRVVVHHATPPLISQCGALLSSDSAATYQWERDGVVIPGATSRTISVGQPGNYTLRVVTEDGCAVMSTPYEVGSLGLPSASLHLPALQAAPGELVRFVLLLDSGYHLPDEHLPFLLTLRFNRTLLFPLDSVVTSIENDGERIITLGGVRTPGSDTLLLLQFVAALGDAESTSLHIDEVRWEDSCAGKVTASDGEFRLLGVCHDEGPRLFHPDGRFALKTVEPNPISGEGRIVYEIIEAGPTALYLTDLLGRRVMTLVDDDLPAGRYQVAFDAGEMPSGIYCVTLQTATLRASRMLQMVR